MSEVKFVDAKWSVLYVHKGEYQIDAPGTGDYEGQRVAIAIVRSWDGQPPVDQLESISRLMSAAPDMLAALESLLAACKSHSFPNVPVQQHFAAAEAAIAKAKGE